MDEPDRAIGFVAFAEYVYVQDLHRAGLANLSFSTE